MTTLICGLASSELERLWRLVEGAELSGALAGCRSVHNGCGVSEKEHVSRSIPTNFKLLYSEDRIAEAVQRLGAGINEWASRVWTESHTDLIVIPVLRGGIFFFADLVRELACSIEIAPARTWAYDPDAGNAARGSVQVNIDGVPAKGRSVLVVDDICDSGRSLAELTQRLRGAGAREVKSAALIHREVAGSVFTPDWVGFQYRGSEWFVGYGMDDGDRWRNLPSIYIIQQSSSS